MNSPSLYWENIFFFPIISIIKSIISNHINQKKITIFLIFKKKPYTPHLILKTKIIHYNNMNNDIKSFANSPPLLNNNSNNNNNNNNSSNNCYDDNVYSLLNLSKGSSSSSSSSASTNSNSNNNNNNDFSSTSPQSSHSGILPLDSLLYMSSKKESYSPPLPPPSNANTFLQFPERILKSPSDLSFHQNRFEYSNNNDNNNNNNNNNNELYSSSNSIQNGYNSSIPIQNILSSPLGQNQNQISINSLNNHNNHILVSNNNNSNNNNINNSNNNTSNKELCLYDEDYIKSVYLICGKCNSKHNISINEFFKHDIKVIPGPEDKSYEFRCFSCSKEPLFFRHLFKTWKEMIHTSLYNLEREKRYRFSHYREIIKYVLVHSKELLVEREKVMDIKMKNVMTATLSYNRKVFVSFARDSGMWSNYRQGDDVTEDDRGLLLWKGNDSWDTSNLINRDQSHTLRCKVCSHNSQFYFRDLIGSTVIPGPGDTRYEFICYNCSPNKKPQLTHLSKSWKEVAHTALYNLELLKKYRFSHQIEIASYVKGHQESFAFNREMDNIKNRLSTVLSRYKKNFTSIGRYTGMWSNWRDGDENLPELQDFDDDEELFDAVDPDDPNFKLQSPSKKSPKKQNNSKSPLSLSEDSKKRKDTSPYSSPKKSSQISTPQKSGLSTPSSSTASSPLKSTSPTPTKPGKHPATPLLLDQSPLQRKSPNTFSNIIQQQQQQHMQQQHQLYSTNQFIFSPNANNNDSSNNLMSFIHASPNGSSAGNGGHNPNGSPKQSPDSSINTPTLNNSPNFNNVYSPIIFGNGGANSTNGRSKFTSYNISNSILSQTSPSLQLGGNISNNANGVLGECFMCKKTKSLPYKCVKNPIYPYTTCSRQYCRDCAMMHQNQKYSIHESYCCPECFFTCSSSVTSANSSFDQIPPPPSLQQNQQQQHYQQNNSISSFYLMNNDNFIINPTPTLYSTMNNNNSNDTLIINKNKLVQQPQQIQQIQLLPNNLNNNNNKTVSRKNNDSKDQLLNGFPSSHDHKNSPKDKRIKLDHPSDQLISISSPHLTNQIPQLQSTNNTNNNNNFYQYPQQPQQQQQQYYSNGSTYENRQLFSGSNNSSNGLAQFSNNQSGYYTNHVPSFPFPIVSTNNNNNNNTNNNINGNNQNSGIHHHITLPNLMNDNLINNNNNSFQMNNHQLHHSLKSLSPETKITPNGVYLIGHDK
ncbi:hypothetical protein DLAC_05093 [Tieghemostelium lacteum]|uniref:Uncharacterized protein n=1 Tax=Tieghemostelium lacteum TaxID=361077 RepID=A0A151ZIB3_TIELA|nr:hypothetical protein DLAC_05093 [Tieghemostelium lacteum]|eukprot:KYQ93706.1 hypothetical protein DLAC_05093 [Tieghemostelium lacteum]